MATLGRVAATRKGSRKDVVIYTPRKTTLPGVCSSVEAGEVARVAWRRGGDLHRGLRLRLRMTVHIRTYSNLRDRRTTLAMT